ncbi:MAG: 4-hydroxy-3-methylbut-2-enyl diphosphate reductase [Coriobacteriales bacterium]|nr:4-hydroxy-3-methylbut-2-enyl diphosphate reductase [Coriobacteriales bacterium]
MATVQVADHAGACFGVERALNITRQALSQGTGRVHTLGPLIHNPIVVDDLAAEGAVVVGEPEEVPAGDTLVLRTHGVHPAVERRAAEVGACVVDATCPFVKRVHAHCERLMSEGYQVIMVGEAGHPEVEGALGHAPGSLVLGSAQDARKANLSRRVGVVAQTTLTREVLQEVVGVLLIRCDEVRVFNTICQATRERQEAARELAGSVDVMVVVGGRNSANTTHLAQVCAEVCPRTHHVEQASELEPAWFAGAQDIGITAGASTPAEHIAQMRAAIEELCDQPAVAGR